MSSLAPSLLLAMPHLTDPTFAQAVVLLCSHDEDGAFGLIVNRPMQTTGRVVVPLQPPAETDRELELWFGGPVEPSRLWLLVSADADETWHTGAMPVSDGLWLSSSPDLVRRMLEPEPPPHIHMVVGYAGWAPGQLDAELEASDWLFSDVAPSLIFGGAPESMWERALRRLGVEPAALHASRGVH